jgi:tetratricopeptide (TPR) repeat protein
MPLFFAMQEGAYSERRKRSADLLMEAEAELRANRPAQAQRKTQRILKSDPAHAGALEVSAKALWLLGRYEPLLLATERLIQLNPYEPGYHSLRGAALQALGRFREAIRSYRRSLELGDSQAETSALFLEECQQALVEQMLETDEHFRDAYRRDPISACHSLGIHIRETSLHVDAASLSVRPS